MSNELPIGTLVNGHERITVRYRNRKPGEIDSEEIEVPLISLRHAIDYLNKVDDMLPFIEFVCGRPTPWGDTLTDDSAFAVDELAKRLNDPRIDRYVDRQTATVAKLLPMAKKAQALQRSVPTA